MAPPRASAPGEGGRGQVHPRGQGAGAPAGSAPAHGPGASRDAPRAHTPAPPPPPPAHAGDSPRAAGAPQAERGGGAAVKARSAPHRGHREARAADRSGRLPREHSRRTTGLLREALSTRDVQRGAADKAYFLADEISSGHADGELLPPVSLTAPRFSPSRRIPSKLPHRKASRPWVPRIMGWHGGCRISLDLTHSSEGGDHHG